MVIRGSRRAFGFDFGWSAPGFGFGGCSVVVFLREASVVLHQARFQESLCRGVAPEMVKPGCHGATISGKGASQPSVRGIMCKPPHTCAYYYIYIYGRSPRRAHLSTFLHKRDLLADVQRPLGNLQCVW